MPKSVVVNPFFDWGNDRAPKRPYNESLIYEAHVRGLTYRNPKIPEELRGTYAGIAHPTTIDHLNRLGITAIELMPVHQFVHDHGLVQRGLRNYWGYNTIGFLAPHNAYAATGQAGQQVPEFKAMVKALHEAGIEVILDVVYNHTAEGNHLGPTLNLKGIDNPAFYRLVPEDAAHYFDTTGTGNSLNVAHPAALRLIMDSLRYWVTDMHVDGFRFDLATTLTRQTGEQDIHSAFLDLVHQDPVLNPVKLIAEPWDVAGYQLGGFPSRWSEWNGQYRDTVRDFWRGTDNLIGELGLRLTGSGDIYSSNRRTPGASVNFITAHDGFTLADLTSYDEKHNEANGDDNNDGESDNRSWNCGAEGPTDDPDVLELRDRQRRNLLGTLLLSAGVPMILGGDEFGRTQGGNNNAYCQDNETSWYDWSRVDTGLLAFVRTAIALRREHPALRPRDYLRTDGGTLAQMVLYRPDGQLMTDEDWQNPVSKTLAVALDGRQLTETETADGQLGDHLLLLINAHHEQVDFALPSPDTGWEIVLTTDDPTNDPAVGSGRPVTVRNRSLLLLRRQT
jgi:glycogen operon protein